MVSRVADHIIREYKTEDIVLVILLKGGVFFGVDLARLLAEQRNKGQVYMEFLRVASYGNRRDSSGDVRIEMDIQQTIRDKDVIVVDEVADTCQTLAAVINYLRSKGPRSLKVCVAIEKICPNRRQDVQLDFIGFGMVEGFLVGYGLDHEGARRADCFIERLD